MSESKWVSFEYRGFYDFPRTLLLQHLSRWYLLDSAFDDELDEYEESYTVYLLKGGDWADHAKQADWNGFCEQGKKVGSIKIEEVSFDSTRREKLDGSIFSKLL